MEKVVAGHTTPSCENSIAPEQSFNGKSFRVLQWNILADGLAQHGDFIKVSKEVLEWESRGPKLLAELVNADADLICLQEVNHYDDFLLPNLRERGYTGLFHPKASSPAQGYGYPPDGCAVFIRTQRFHLKEHERLGYTGADGNKMSQGALICHLEDKTCGRPLLLATTHLKAKKGADNDAVRLRQAGQLLERLSDAVGRGGGEVVLCGDFNAPPTSEACALLRSGNGRVRLRSAFSSDAGPDGEPAFTTWKFRTGGGSKHTIDYVWYGGPSDKSTDSLRVAKLWRLPNEEEIGAKGLPTTDMPSDHLPLICELEWLIDESGRKQGAPATKMPCVCM